MNRLIWKIWVPTVSCLLVSFLLWSSYIYFSLESYIERNQYNEILNLVSIMESQISPLMTDSSHQSIQNYCRKQKSNLGEGRLTIILPDGQVVGDSSVADCSELENHTNRPEFQDALKNQQHLFQRYSETLKGEMVYITKPVYEDKVLRFVMRYSTTVKSFERAVAHLRVTLSGTAFLIVVFTMIPSFWLTHRVTKSINQIRQAASRFAVGDFSKQIELPDIAELRNLVETMNQMSLDLKTRIKTVRHQKNQLEAILSGMHEGVIALNDQNEIITMNQAAADLFKIEIERGIGRKLIYLLRFPELHEFCQLVWQKKEPMSIEKTWRHGKFDVLFHIQVSPMYKRSGEVTGLVLVFNDVTRIRHLEQMRKDFVANVSHELRTPLTAIQGFVETLLDGAAKNPNDCMRFLGIIEKQTQRLNNLIADLLELSHLETMEKEEGLRGAKQYEILPLLKDIETIVLEKLEKNHQHLVLSCEPTIQGFVNDSLIEQAILNLVDNASNYSPENTAITVDVQNTDSALVFKISDQGPGIPEDLQHRVFERFYRVDKGRSREKGGTGIGLSIVRHVVDLHHGHIEINNLPAGGCCFTITLPNLNIAQKEQGETATV